MTPFPVPKICECKTLEIFDSIEARLSKIDEAVDGKRFAEALREIRKIIQAQRDLYKTHVTDYQATFQRSMVEMHKFKEINGNAQQLPLQTNAWQTGDLKRVVEPPPKKQKKDKKPPQ